MSSAVTVAPPSALAMLAVCASISSSSVGVVSSMNGVNSPPAYSSGANAFCLEF